jgi:hypothetical protein
MGGPCGMYGRQERRITRFWWGDLRLKDNMKNPSRKRCDNIKTDLCQVGWGVMDWISSGTYTTAQDQMFGRMGGFWILKKKKSLLLCNEIFGGNLIFVLKLQLLFSCLPQFDFFLLFRSWKSPVNILKIFRVKWLRCKWKHLRKMIFKNISRKGRNVLTGYVKFEGGVFKGDRPCILLEKSVYFHGFEVVTLTSISQFHSSYVQ